MSLKTSATSRDPAWFNSTHNYRDATEKAIDAQTTAAARSIGPDTDHALAGLDLGEEGVQEGLLSA